MNKYLSILAIAFFAIGGCSSDNDTPTPVTSSADTTNTETTTTQKAAPVQVSPDNAFSTQINALNAAKQVGGAANESIDKHQQALEAAQQ